MRLLIRLAVAGTCFLAAGCSSYRLAYPDQLYVAQSYLPLPPGYVPPQSWNQSGPAPGESRPTKPSDQPVGTGVGACRQVAHLWRDPSSRNEFRPMPGMALRFTETSYQRSRAIAVPSLSEWRWQLPAMSDCSGLDPGWDRRDILAIRHLLSSARVAAAWPYVTGVDYFRRLAWRMGCTADDCDFSAMRRGMLDPFVGGLRIQYRDANQPDAEQTGGDAVPIPPEARTRPLGAESLTHWFRSIDDVGNSDFFRMRADVGGQSLPIGSFCGRLPGQASIAAPDSRADTERFVQNTVRRPLDQLASGGDVSAVDWPSYRDLLFSGTQTAPDNDPAPVPDAVRSPACNFSLATLALEVPASWQAEGDEGRPVPFPMLSLVSSGDTLLLFRPLAHLRMLDSSGRWLCPAEGSTPDAPATSICSERDRLSQGFVDFGTEFPVEVDGTLAPIEIPAAMTVAEFEARYGGGRRIARISRRLPWLPPVVTLRDLRGGRTRQFAIGELAQDDRVTLHFLAAGDRNGSQRSIALGDNAKGDILLAPDDIIHFVGISEDRSGR